MPSFDIVSEIDKVELKNAVDNASRELATRFDFRGVEASFELDKETVKVIAEADFQLNQMMDILRNNLAKRGVDSRAMDIQDMVHSGKSFSQQVKFKNGIETPVAKKITKAIKDAKMKVQTQIQGEQVRVTGKKRDDLQAVIQLVKDSDFEQPFQFENFRD
ncbi:YajQ family cyclic di-GMP-binding protein [Salinivibrio proteolyticus]|uniref:Nucleotide-binding protein N7E60_07250 n=1 Tax=Salinivibrio proteolyticus TaxID=334715 RepID=A0ABY7LCJ3_9GAMM|nr:MULTISPECIES: YajQ family cyclic di-GMP-binding protein [Salinivibrio]OOF11074.1 YajQ family cyclic di-GMP-binding protein [Salinivibrio sp. PR5]OOF15964.1 YajQ family cyclic di-GMP-binding protein [Salinivibrio sp. PR919]OOF17504.1 YajQ family cyclic di-GMP-binding protein [Salinivibrio sp. PR932]OOF22560.1 YajQ family cyclic di-GMP-binding protein [Salinivibrio sp. IB574]OOF25283.1 YajQ family cyclic di-GMP-binding protein [Salinivibrio sp. IB872]